VQATDWRAEHAIRPAVVCRKAWGGKRTWTDAVTWQVLSSILATAHLQQRDPVMLLLPLLRAPGTVLADLAIPGAVGVACERRRRRCRRRRWSTPRACSCSPRVSQSGARTPALPVAMASHVSPKLNSSV
jgi:hypothetical protein